MRSTALIGVAVGLLAFAEPASSACVQFWAGLCPGGDDCMCTTGAACTTTPVNTSSPEWLAASTRACAGKCKKVEHDKCPGGNGCLLELGECGSPPAPPHPGPPPPPGPPAGEPFGPDVSSYQGEVNWHEVKSAGAGFGIAKATEGLSLKDPQFSNNWAGMKAAGIPVRGAYHFGHPDDSAQASADNFVRAVGPAGVGEFYVLDIESATSRAKGNLTAEADVASWCLAFVNAVMSSAKVPARKVWVYTGEWFWDPKAGGSNALSNHPLWVSGYAASPPMPKGWLTWTMWQYTDKGSVAGVSGGCDVSKFKGSQTELELLVA